MSSMFRGITSHSFDQDVSDWVVSGVTNMSDMFDTGSLSQANYDKLLTGWTGWDGTGATKTLQSNVTFGADNATYSSGKTWVVAARNYLITGLTWSITDAGGA
jgi:hypothetical protein